MLDNKKCLQLSYGLVWSPKPGQPKQPGNQPTASKVAVITIKSGPGVGTQGSKWLQKCLTSERWKWAFLLPEEQCTKTQKLMRKPGVVEGDKLSGQPEHDFAVGRVKLTAHQVGQHDIILQDAEGLKGVTVEMIWRYCNGTNNKVTSKYDNVLNEWSQLEENGTEEEWKYEEQ